jgi:16S rRNA processing protein RimM
MANALFTIGKVTGVHGLNGNLKVWSFAQSIDTFGAGNIVLLQSEDGRRSEYTILRASAHKKGVLLMLENVDSRDLAEALVGHEILIHRDQLPEPEEDTWYWQDLIGLNVMDETRGHLGKIKEIFPTGANDVLVVAPEKGMEKSKEVLIPMHRHFVISVNLDQQTMITRLPEDYE